jgi:hypothetical protein
MYNTHRPRLPALHVRIKVTGAPVVIAAITIAAVLFNLTCSSGTTPVRIGTPETGQTQTPSQVEKAPPKTETTIDAGESTDVSAAKTDVAAPRSSPPSVETDAPSISNASGAGTARLPQIRADICEELAYRCYRPITWDELASGNTDPGRVALTLTPQQYNACTPCPPKHRCQPCLDTTLFAKDARSKKSAFLTAFSGPHKKIPHRLFLCLEEGYMRHVNRYTSDPRREALTVDHAVPIKALEKQKDYPSHRRARHLGRAPLWETSFYTVSIERASRSGDCGVGHHRGNDPSR